MTLTAAVHRLEAQRIRLAAANVLRRGFVQIASRYCDMALSHELAADRADRHNPIGKEMHGVQDQSAPASA